jgi:hypothetical protein
MQRKTRESLIKSLAVVHRCLIVSFPRRQTQSQSDAIASVARKIGATAVWNHHDRANQMQLSEKSSETFL